MKRRESREVAFLLCFGLSLNSQSLDELLQTTMDAEGPQVDEFSLRLLELVCEHTDEIDELITQNLKSWTLERIPKVSLAVLRISCAQLLYMPDIPASVVINEAVDLAKKFGGDDEYSFVNGALRGVYESTAPQRPEQDSQLEQQPPESTE